MTTVTIPKKLAEKGDLVIIQRREYEDLLEFKKAKEFTPTPAQKRALSRAEANLKQGKTLSYHELAKNLGFAN
jgi:O6-methylguanine-DNA--protein-cysteine methyltransferase